MQKKRINFSSIPNKSLNKRHERKTYRLYKPRGLSLKYFLSHPIKIPAFQTVPRTSYPDGSEALESGNRVIRISTSCFIDYARSWNKGNMPCLAFGNTILNQFNFLKWCLEPCWMFCYLCSIIVSSIYKGWKEIDNKTI